MASEHVGLEGAGGGDGLWGNSLSHRVAAPERTREEGSVSWRGSGLGEVVGARFAVTKTPLPLVLLSSGGVLKRSANVRRGA